MPSLPAFTGRVSRRASLLIALAAASPWALAQSAGKAAATAPAPLAWPTKPLKIIVGFPAGSSPDLTARTFSEPLSKALGQPVIVTTRWVQAETSAPTQWPRPGTTTPSG